MNRKILIATIVLSAIAVILAVIWILSLKGDKAAVSPPTSGEEPTAPVFLSSTTPRGFAVPAPISGSKPSGKPSAGSTYDSTPDFDYGFRVDAKGREMANLVPYIGSFTYEATYIDEACEVEYLYARIGGAIRVQPVVVGSCFDHPAWYTVSGAVRNLVPGEYRFSVYRIDGKLVSTRDIDIR